MPVAWLSFNQRKEYMVVFYPPNNWKSAHLTIQTSLGGRGQMNFVCWVYRCRNFQEISVAEERSAQDPFACL